MLGIQLDHQPSEAHQTSPRRMSIARTDSDFNPHHPLTLSPKPPFFKILPRCPSISPASRASRRGLCYDPGRRLAWEFGQQAQQPGGMSHMRQHAPDAARQSITVPPQILDYCVVAGSIKNGVCQVIPCKSAQTDPHCKIAKLSALARELYMESRRGHGRG